MFPLQFRGPSNSATKRARDCGRRSQAWFLLSDELAAGCWGKKLAPRVATAKTNWRPAEAHRTIANASLRSKPQEAFTLQVTKSRRRYRKRLFSGDRTPQRDTTQTGSPVRQNWSRRFIFTALERRRPVNQSTSKRADAEVAVKYRIDGRIAGNAMQPISKELGTLQSSRVLKFLAGPGHC